MDNLARYYDKDFWGKYEWISCFECDIIFTDLEKLFEHQKRHIDEDVLRYSNLGLLKEKN